MSILRLCTSQVQQTIRTPIIMLEHFVFLDCFFPYEHVIVLLVQRSIVLDYLIVHMYSKDAKMRDTLDRNNFQT